MTHQDGLENRRSGNVTEGSNPSLSADLRGISPHLREAYDALFAPRSTSDDGAEVGTPPEWMYCPNGVGFYRFDKGLFAAWLEREGIKTGTPPVLPVWCIEDPETDFAKWVGKGISKWTYFARGKSSGRIKIGMSNNPEKRVRELVHANYGEEAELLVTLRGEHFEKAYHHVFAEWCEGHEWFAPHPDILAEIDRLNSLGPKRGCNLDPALSMNESELRYAC